jgi:hypothetical protein
MAVAGFAIRLHRLEDSVDIPAELKPLEDLNASPKIKSQALVDQANDILANGWTRWGVGLPTLKPPVAWLDGDRGSFDYSLNSWEPLTILIPAFEYSGREDIYRLTVDFVADWLETIQKPLLEKPAAAIANIVGGSKTGAWYDMAAGLRIYRLAYVLDLVALVEPERKDLLDLLRHGLEFHHKLLCEDKYFAARSNHGLYQALGQLAAARRFETRLRHGDYVRLAEKRLEKILESHFFPSGVHKEHSPSYHYMVMGSITGALVDGVIKSPALVQLITRMEHALSWMLQPNMHLPTIGDSDPRWLSQSLVRAERLTDESLRYLLSDGQIGAFDPATVAAYYDAGYAFARMCAPELEPTLANYSFLAQHAGFHSMVHKHADHLSFTWYDRQRDILIDPGRYAYTAKTTVGSDLFKQGFWYADPKRIYVESTRAHNCVEIDDRSYPRRGVKPFGSALRLAADIGGLALTDCELTHDNGVRHRRVLIMRPNHFLLVIDMLADRSAQHDYRQWLQFAPEWTLAQVNGGFCAQADADDKRKAETLSILNLFPENPFAAPVRGQEEPRLQGWTSNGPNSLTPSTSLCAEALARASAQFGALLTFGSDASLDRTAPVFDAHGRRGLIRWRDERGDHALEIALGEAGRASVRFSEERSQAQELPVA